VVVHVCPHLTLEEKLPQEKSIHQMAAVSALGKKWANMCTYKCILTYTVPADTKSIAVKGLI